MSIFNALLGNASEVNIQDVQQEFQPILADGELLQSAFKVVRDMFVFTNKRLILVDKQGITGKKAEFLSIPYSSITRFSKESTGLMDADAELKIWIRGQQEPIVKEFRKDSNVNKVYQQISQGVLN